MKGAPSLSPPPTVSLNCGVQMPVLGLGVFQSSPEETRRAVGTAIGCGYRLIDTASAYLNERAVGEAIRNSGADRRELFVTTKAFPTEYGRAVTRRAFEASLARLGLDYLDLYLIHWPVPTDFARTIEAYLTAESLLAEGYVRAIGVSNFKPTHLDELAQHAAVVPAVNQVELHPFFTRPALRADAQERGVIVQAWSPIGGVFALVDDATTPDGATSPLDHPIITGLARTHGKSASQIILRWHLQHGIAVIPKSVRPHRIIENRDVFDFELSSEEVARIDALDTGVSAGPDPDTFTADSFVVDIDGQ